MNTRTFNTNDNVPKENKNWVLYGWGGTLDTLPRDMGIQQQLRKATRRMRRQVYMHKQMNPEFGVAGLFR